MRLDRLCDVCAARWEKRNFPLEIEYVGGAVSDFSLCGPWLLVLKSVAQELAAKFHGVEIRPIIYYEGDSLWSTERRRIQAKKYRGPELVELWFPFNVPLGEDRGPFDIRGSCEVCGRFYAYVKGVEHRPDEPADNYPDGYNRHRRPEDGLRIPAALLEGHYAFRYNETRSLVVQEVKEFIELRRFTNADFVDYGELS